MDQNQLTGHKDRSIAFLDEDKKAPYELMRSLFIVSSLSPESFVLERKLPQSAIEVIKKDNWEGVRQSFTRRNPDSMKTLIAMMTDTSVVMEIDMYTMKMAQVQDQVNFLKDYHKKWGDYFARYPDGNIFLNHFGQPVLMEIPTTPQELTARKAHYSIILDYLKVLDSIDNVQMRLEGKVTEITIDAEPVVEYAHLLEVKKDGD